MKFFKNNFFKLATVLALGIVSLAVVFVRTPPTKVFISENRAEASKYGISVYDKTGNLILSLSPLNDYFYQGIAKEHIQDEIKNTSNGNFLQKISTSISDLGLNRKSLIWDTEGKNSKGYSSENYTVKSSLNNIEIIREVNFASIHVDAIGQALTICPDCLVVDDKKRAYFNGTLITGQKISNAINLGFTPVIIGESQAMPSDISKISILSNAGHVEMEIAIISRMQVFIQDKWHLVEFRLPVNAGRDASVVQTIYIPN